MIKDRKEERVSFKVTNQRKELSEREYPGKIEASGFVRATDTKDYTMKDIV